MEFLVRLLDLLDEGKIAKLRNELRTALDQQQKEKRFLLWVQLTDEQRVWALKDQIDSANESFKKAYMVERITHYRADYENAPIIRLPWHGGDSQDRIVVIMVDRPFRLQWRNP